MKRIFLLLVTLIVTLSINAQDQVNSDIKILDAKQNWFQLKNNKSLINNKKNQKKPLHKLYRGHFGRAR